MMSRSDVAAKLMTNLTFVCPLLAVCCCCCCCLSSSTRVAVGQASRAQAEASVARGLSAAAAAEASNSPPNDDNFFLARRSAAPSRPDRSFGRVPLCGLAAKVLSAAAEIRPASERVGGQRWRRRPLLCVHRRRCSSTGAAAARCCCVLFVRRRRCCCHVSCARIAAARDAQWPALATATANRPTDRPGERSGKLEVGTHTHTHSELLVSQSVAVQQQQQQQHHTRIALPFANGRQ